MANIAQRVEALLTPIINELGYIVWDVEYVKEGPDYFLRITIDSEEGISINDCEKVHRAIDPVLDEADPIEAAYTLQVSSPGVERTLSRPEHYLACIGEKAELKLFTAGADGKKSRIGIIRGCDGKSVTLDCDGEAETVGFDIISKAHTVFDF